MEEYDVKMLAEQPWEETIDILTADMDPGSIDIIVLTDRYREYIGELQEYDLSVPARAIRIAAALLNMKARALYFEDEPPEEEENPMDFEEPLEEEEGGYERNPELEMGPDLDMPVKPKPKRRVSLDELKDSLRSAMEVKERREERQEMREEIDQHFEMDEKDLTEKLNSLFGRIKNLVSAETREKVDFDHLIETGDNQEKIEKFKHVLHLENDRKVQLIQKEFLGQLQVKPEDEEVPN
ncbi:MAG: segregation/condensation protein A [Candidatus Nanohaloarchaea archaeon]